MASGRAFAEGGVVYYMNRAHGTNRTGGPTPQRNRRKRRGGANEALRTMLLIALATLLFIAAAVGIARCSRPDATTVMAPAATTPAATVLAATTLAPTQTPEPQASDAPAQTEAAQPTSETLGDDSYTQDEVIAPQAIVAAQEGYLPIYSKADTEEKIIAITVDDCFQTENLRQIVQCAIDNDAKLTIFPIGKNLEREELCEVIRFAYENGMEFENHSYSHSTFYRLSSEEMAAEIFNQQRIVSKALGVNYQMHFMRTRGGDNRRDLRTHQYIEKLGYYGMAHWTLSGSSASVTTLKSTLAPGNIYLFHTTDNDLSKLLGFIPYATQQGYRLVTLNEMFGLPENEVSELTESPDAWEVPEPAPYVITEYKMLNRNSDNNYVYDVYMLQERLIELGWLSGTADGVYGDATYMAVGYFQKAIGMQPNGNANPATQVELYKDTAPMSRDGKTVYDANATPTPSPTPLRTTEPRDLQPQQTVPLTLFD